jgi:two-component system cell cycle sensor histidine kinase/response regulator CckA
LINTLLVMNDAARRHAILGVLGEAMPNMSVTETADGHLAFVLLTEERFDCVLLEEGLFGGDGIDFLKRVRSYWGGRGPAVVLIAERDDESVLAEAIRSGAQACMFSDDLRGPAFRSAIAAAMVRLRQETERHEILAELERTNAQLSRSNLALLESEQRFRGVFETAPHGMALVSPRGRLLMVNTALAKMLGYTQDELCALDFQAITHPDDLDADLHQVQQMLAGNITSFRMEKRYLRKSGETVWALLSVSMVRDGSGHPVHFVSEILDLTDIKRAQADLQQAHRLEAIGQLTGGVAHDFNNLLMAMQLSLEVLHDQPHDDPMAADSLRMLADAVERGTQLTQRLLAFARRQPLEPRVVDVNEIMGDALVFLRRTLREDIQIVANFADTVWLCEIDPGQFQNALLNLAVNAGDAMPQGGTLTLRTRCGWLGDDELGGKGEGIKPGEYVTVEISDTGTGMPGDVIDRAFEPFFTTKDVGKGTGLGLSMVYGFVRQSGGHIAIASELDRGTTILIHLPRTSSSVAVTAPVQPETRVAPKGLETILVVEDNDDVRRTLRVMLRKEGYTVEVAATGREAIELIDTGRFRPQMLVADVVLPDRITGREVAEAVLLRVPECRVLFMSGYAENVLVHGGRVDAGMVLLHKPFSKKDLLAKIDELLSRPADL